MDVVGIVWGMSVVVMWQKWRRKKEERWL